MLATSYEVWRGSRRCCSSCLPNTLEAHTRKGDKLHEAGPRGRGRPINTIRRWTYFEQALSQDPQDPGLPVGRAASAVSGLAGACRCRRETSQGGQAGTGASGISESVHHRSRLGGRAPGNPANHRPLGSGQKGSRSARRNSHDRRGEGPQGKPGDDQVAASGARAEADHEQDSAAQDEQSAAESSVRDGGQVGRRQCAVRSADAARQKLEPGPG